MTRGVAGGFGPAFFSFVCDPWLATRSGQSGRGRSARANVDRCFAAADLAGLVLKEAVAPAPPLPNGADRRLGAVIVEMGRITGEAEK